MNIKRFIIIAICILLIIWVYHDNRNVLISEYVIDANIPDSFDGFKIVQVSDLHNSDNEKIIEKLKTINPDIIVMTGDMLDSRNTKVDVAASFMAECSLVAPCYYVTGNHEARVMEDYKALKDAISGTGLNILENHAMYLTKGEDTICLIGLHDTGFDLNTGIDYQLSWVLPGDDSYKILLAHRPEYFDKYHGVDLIFSGHAHGGQVRLPLVGGVFAPGQGFFPKYDSGVYTDGERKMVVSRGLGNSLFPFRVNNNPELVVVTLKKG